MDEMKVQTPEQEQPVDPAKQPVDPAVILQLATDIYDFDEKVYKTTGSELGRVFGKHRDRNIHEIEGALTHQDMNVVRSELALISGMARTVQDEGKRRKLMSEYNKLLQRVHDISRNSKDELILDPVRASLNELMLGDRFGDDSHLIICISRAYGSGGNEIGFGLADKLHINYYDADIFRTVLKRMEAEQEGITDITAFNERFQQLTKKNLGIGAYIDHRSPKEVLKDIDRYHGLPMRDALFFNQSDLIVQMAQEQDFVIMGRCADVILEKNHIPHISIYITAPFDLRAKRLMKVHDVSARAASKALKQVDGEHASYYEYYTGRKWGDANNYDLSINSSSYGIEGSVDFILNVLKANKVKGARS